MRLAERRSEKFTYDDYITWSDDERWELIDGVPYNMSPAPSILHQEIVSNLHYILKHNLKGQPCRPFLAPTDVVLSEVNVVQPDVFVVCDKRKIREKHNN